MPVNTRPAAVKTLPLGSLLDRYLVQAFLRVFFASLLIITGLSLIVEFFDRINVFFTTGGSMGAVVRYFVYKAPLSISRMIGFATLFSALFCLGMAARNNEITAMRSSGISVQRIALPLLIVSLLISVSTFFWNETVVPMFAHRAQTTYQTEIRQRQQQSLFGTRDIWMRGQESFINVEHFDVRTDRLERVTMFLLNRDFTLRAVVQIPSLQWNGHEWQPGAGTQSNIFSDQNGKQTPISIPAISETPADLKLLVRNPEEFGFFELQRHISDMKAKGIDTTAYEVDLQAKLALPFISVFVVLLATPFAIRNPRSGGLALSFGTAMAIGFGYWVLAAFCISLGHSGALPPGVAAWLPNAVFAMVGVFCFTAEE
jgi:lipopolysaccharide export system permease protein